MKKHFLLSALLLLWMAACTSDGGDDSPNPGNPPSGKWVVSYYFDKDKVETDNFSGCVFDFQSGGVLVAATGSGNFTGLWSQDSSSGKLAITITGTEALDDASDDWLVVEKTDSSIKLKDDNDEHLEELHFVKQ